MSDPHESLTGSRWDSEKTNYCVNLFHDGLTDAEVSEQMTERYGPPPYTVHSIRSKRGRLERGGSLVVGVSGSSTQNSNRRLPDMPEQTVNGTARPRRVTRAPRVSVRNTPSQGEAENSSEWSLTHLDDDCCTFSNFYSSIRRQLTDSSYSEEKLRRFLSDRAREFELREAGAAYERRGRDGSKARRALTAKSCEKALKALVLEGIVFPDIYKLPERFQQFEKSFDYRDLVAAPRTTKKKVSKKKTSKKNNNSNSRWAGPQEKALVEVCNKLDARAAIHSTGTKNGELIAQALNDSGVRKGATRSTVHHALRKLIPLPIEQRHGLTEWRYLLITNPRALRNMNKMEEEFGEMIQPETSDAPAVPTAAASETPAPEPVQEPAPARPPEESPRIKVNSDVGVTLTTGTVTLRVDSLNNLTEEGEQKLMRLASLAKSIEQ